MEDAKLYVFHARTAKDKRYESSASRSCMRENSDSGWRRQCGCIRTSQKLKEMLQKFPAPPPPSPSTAGGTAHGNHFDNTCISAYCTQTHPTPLYPTTKVMEYNKQSNALVEAETKTATSSRSWQVIVEVVQLVQLSVTATALALYYLIYCYMQLIYYTLRSALYFHNADGPMKITIGVVTLTSLVIGFNLIIRMERLIGLWY